MDKIKNTWNSRTVSEEKKRLVITLEKKFDVIERHEHGHSNSKIGQDVGLPESMVRNIIKPTSEIKEKYKTASAFCGQQKQLQGIEMEPVSVWMEDCNKKCIPNNRAFR